MRTKSFCVRAAAILVSFVLLLPQTASASEGGSALKTVIAEPGPVAVWCKARAENELPPIPLPGPQDQKRGDADGDGKVNYMDAMLVLRHAVGLEKLSKATIKLCDVDSSGDLSYMDAMLILRYAVGLLSRL